MSAKNKKEELSFEDAMQKLETIVSGLEHGELGLEKSLAAFEEGMTLAKVCEDKLNAASGRVEKIMRDFSGAAKLVPVENLTDDANDEAGVDDVL